MSLQNVRNFFKKHESQIDTFTDYINKKPWYFLSVVIVFNIVIKLIYLADASLWIDEASQINLSLKTFKEIIQESLLYPNAPVYTMLLSWWIKLFGIGEFAGRSLSVLFSIANVVLLFFFARRHFNIYTAIFSTLLFSVSFLHLYYSHEIRSYTLVSLLVTLSFWFFLDILQHPDWKKMLWLILVNTLLLYTHLTAILIFPVQALILLFHIRNYRKSLQIGLGFLIPIILLSFWFLNNSWFGGGETVWMSVPKLKDLVNMYSGFFNKSATFLLLLLFIPAIYFLLSSKSEIKDVFWKKLIILLLWSVVPVIILYVSSIYYNPRFISRYILYASIGLYLLVAYICSYKTGNRLVSTLLLTVFIVYSIFSIDLKPSKGVDWRKAVGIYKDELRTTATVTIVSAWYQWVTFSYYYNPDYFRDYNNTIYLLKKDRIYFANSDLIFDDLDLADFDQVILVLCHYEYADPEQTIIRRLKDHYGYIMTDKSVDFGDIRLLVFKEK